MKPMTPRHNISAVAEHSYEDTLRDHYAKLRKESATNHSTARMLQGLDGLLDRCLKLQSPERERTFVEEVCKMGRCMHLAA